MPSSGSPVDLSVTWPRMNSARARPASMWNVSAVNVSVRARLKSGWSSYHPGTHDKLVVAVLIRARERHEAAAGKGRVIRVDAGVLDRGPRLPVGDAAGHDDAGPEGGVDVRSVGVRDRDRRGRGEARSTAPPL